MKPLVVQSMVDCNPLNGWSQSRPTWGEQTAFILWLTATLSLAEVRAGQSGGITQHPEVQVTQTRARQMAQPPRAESSG